MSLDPTTIPGWDPVHGGGLGLPAGTSATAVAAPAPAPAGQGMFDPKKRIDWTQGNPRVATPGWSQGMPDDQGHSSWVTPGGDSYYGDGTPWWSTPNWSDYQADNQWSNLDDPNSPFWQARGGYDSNPHSRAATLLDAAAGDQPIMQLLMGPQWGTQLEDRFAGMNLHPDTVGEMQGTLGATAQDLTSHDFFSMLESSLIPGLLTAFGGPLGAAASGAMGSAYHDGGISDMLKSAGVAGGTAWLGGQATGGVDPTLDPTGLGAGDFTIDESGALGGANPRPGMMGQGFSDFGPFSQQPQEPMQVTDASGTTGVASDAPPGLASSDPANYDWMANQASPDSTLATRMAADPNLAGATGLTGYTAEKPAQPANPERSGSPTNNDLTMKDVQRYAKIAKSVADAVGASKPQGAPERADGQSDTQYAGDLAQYLNLDAQAMADKGLQPGSPEYMDYILQQADSVIAQVLGDANPDGENFAAQLRGKTAQEMQQLQRALFVRGQLDQMMGAGRYTDPFSGTSQDVMGPGMFNPSVAAFQRGKAGDVQDLAGLQGNDALAKMKGMLGRNVDLFGMQGAADASFEQAKQDQLNQDEQRRRRGMLG